MKTTKSFTGSSPIHYYISIDNKMKIMIKKLLLMVSNKQNVRGNR